MTKLTEAVAAQQPQTAPGALDVAVEALRVIALGVELNALGLGQPIDPSVTADKALVAIRDLPPEPQPAPELAAYEADIASLTDQRNRVSDTADRLRAQAARYRDRLTQVGTLAANADEDGDLFGLLQDIAMKVAAVDVPDSAPARASSPKLGDLTISACEIDGHAPHAARVTVDYGLQVTSFCLPPEHGEFLGDALASGKLAAAQAELDKVQRGAATLGMVVVRQARDLYAMHIDVSRGDLEAVKQRVLNAIPDVDDNEPAEQWNGTETGSEWLERTRDGS
jgi:hypothetical protein